MNKIREFENKLIYLEDQISAKSNDLTNTTTHFTNILEEKEKSLNNVYENYKQLCEVYDELRDQIKSKRSYLINIFIELKQS